jgi:predicted DNA-binding antitoxin AbrB/MazE fold protein
MTFDAVYENGVLRPLESLALPNMQHVLVTISNAPAATDDVAGYFEPEEWEAAKHDDVSLQEVRRALSSFRDRSRTQRSQPGRTLIGQFLPRHQRSGEALPRGWRRLADARRLTPLIPA